MTNSKYLKSLSIMAALGAHLTTFQNLAYAGSNSAPEKFKIIWHVGPNSESLADAREDDPRIARLRSKVDGYYFLVLAATSTLTYWPERPLHCRMNFRNLERWNQEEKDDPEHFVRLNGVDYGVGHKEGCTQALADYRQKKWEALYGADAARGKKVPTIGAFVISEHEEALKRVLKNLKIKEEQAAGKTVMSEMILISTDTGPAGAFSYDAARDEISMVRLPKSYGFLAENGIHLDRAMTYQEPHTQGLPDHNSLLRVPMNPGEDTSYFNGQLGTPCRFCLPDNLRMIGMLEDAFSNAQERSPRMAINIRAWNEKKHGEEILKRMGTRDFAKFDGINIEGSDKKMEKASYATTVKGAAWILQNTKYPISMLIPGSLDRDNNQTNLLVNRDKYAIENLINYVKTFDQQLSAEMKLPTGKHAICDSRMSIIVGGYGAPLHMEPLPLYRRDQNGKLLHPAGTVGMQILVLERFREKLCNGSAKPQVPTVPDVNTVLGDIMKSCTTDSTC
jgi:hypothetical protein